MRRADLDALRGVAVALVVLDHLRVPGVGDAGTVGVSVFFVLSGWLITGLLLREGGLGTIDLGAFWRRRARRLLPALVVLLLACSLWALAVGDRAVARPATVIGALLFVNNWAAADDVALGALHHTWSLAVEEQFYLLWPLVIALALSVRGGRRRLPLLTALLAGASVAATVRLVALGALPARVYAGTDTRAASILAGALLAMTLGERTVAWRRIRTPLLAAASALLVALCLMTPHAPVTLLVAPWAATVVALLGIALAPRLDRVPGLTWLGLRSYGIYLWHHPLLVMLAPLVHGPWHWPAALGLVVASLVIAELSWRLVEQPFLRAPRSARTPGRGAGGPFVRRQVPADA